LAQWKKEQGSGVNRPTLKETLGSGDEIESQSKACVQAFDGIFYWKCDLNQN